MQNVNALTELIQWCNENLGFATIVLSVFTLVVSIIAVIVSISTARLPYKKRLKIETGDYISSNGSSGLHVTAINCGNMDLTISSMGFIDGKSFLINLDNNFQYPVKLKNGEYFREFYSYDSNLFNQLEGRRRIVAFVKDSEHRIYKKRMRVK